MPSLDSQTPIIQSPSDDKQYRHITLSNDMQVLLVHDPSIFVPDDGDSLHSSAMPEDGDAGSASAVSGSDAGDAGGAAPHSGRAAVAMTVASGSFSDPPELQGLSHYLEHMLFMGSENFPGENEYDDFLGKHAGSSNAYTEAEYTNFHFDVEPAALRGALSRFAGFFTAPLFLESALEREVQAVDSEFTGVQQDDHCRLIGAMSHMVRSGHPLHTFMWGNKRSLWDAPREAGIDVRTRILEHYKKQYSASRMRLVVSSGQCLDQLQQWTEELFAAVPNSKQKPMSMKGAGNPFESSVFCLAPAVKERHHIIVTFQLPPLLMHYDRKAEDILGHLVGHEGPGSLLSALKSRNWATSLSAGVNNDGGCQNTAYSLFQVEITLTDEGLHAGAGCGLAAAGLLFEYLSMLRAHGPQQWVWDESRRINEMRFRFKQDHDALDTVTELSSSMLVYSPEHLLVGSYLHGKWDANLVQKLLSLMQPDSTGVRIDVQTFEYDALSQALPDAFADIKQQEEPWFGMRFLSGPLPAALVAQWCAASQGEGLTLPPVNPFIATEFALIEAPPAVTAAAGNTADGTELPAAAVLAPECLLDGPGLRLLHRSVTTFKTPHAVALFRVSSPVLNVDASTRATALMLADTWNDVVTETAYQADLAGLVSHIALDGSEGFEVSASGFSDKLPAFACALFQALTTLQATSNWPGLKKRRERRIRNGLMDVSKHANWLRLRLLMTGNFDWQSTMAGVQACTPEAVAQLANAVAQSCHIEVLVEGNLSAQRAIAMSEQIRSMLGSAQLVAGSVPGPRCALLPAAVPHVIKEEAHNADERNSFVQVYVQCGVYTDRLRALQLLCHQVLEEPLYNTLRTQQQLGYSVGMSPTVTAGVVGLLVSVASDFSPAFVERAIERFLSDQVVKLGELSDQDFDQHVESLSMLRLEPFKNIGEQADEHWSAVWTRTYHFYERYAVDRELQQLTKQDLLDFYTAHVAAASRQRRRLTVHICSQLPPDESKSAGDGRPAAEERAVHIVDLAAMKAKLSLAEPPHGKVQPVNRADATGPGFNQ